MQRFFLCHVQGFGRQPAVVQRFVTGTRMPQRPEAVIDDERRERGAALFERAVELPLRVAGTHGEQGRTVIIEPCHVLILADS